MIDLSKTPFRLQLTALLLPALFFFANPSYAQTVLVSPGSTWKYLDDGSDQGTAWVDASFDDSGWSSGPAQLGYGDVLGDEATIVSFGPSAANKFITTYFRHGFQVANPAQHLTLDLRLLKDDGAIVFLNGQELARSNIASPPVNYLFPAFSELQAPEENEFLPFFVPVDALVPGNNVLAVEVHQRTGASPDLGFDLGLTGLPNVVVTRGPYLNLSTSDSVVVRWRTTADTNSRVRFGPSPGNFTTSVDELALTRDHEVEITGLMPDTTYYYVVGSTTEDLAGGDALHSFSTHPVPGTVQPVRIWAIGDSGTASPAARAVRDSYLNFTGSTPTDVWLMLGDNAYRQGTDDEYQLAVFETYEELLTNTTLWPARGNHEVFGGVFYDIFSLPAAGEAGGVASGTESFFSFDYANVHFVCLDSVESSRAVGGAMYTWLEMDLASTDQPWIIAFWHHPPYSKSSHDSDSPTESTLGEMREVFLPVLEAGGVDLVLCGHSHSYERSFLLDGHYGLSGTLTPDMVLDDGDGDPGGDGAYRKVAAGNSGTVYAVAGNAGQASSGMGTLDHPAMFVSMVVLGSLVIDVDDDVMSVRFQDDNGTVLDSFSIGETGESFCFGDGGDTTGCTDCPCGNNASAGSKTGCINSSGEGAVLSASGIPRVTNDRLRFKVTDAPASSFGILFSASNRLPNVGSCPPGSGILSPALDGLRCIGGSLKRHGTRATDANGSIGETNPGWGAPAGPPGGLIQHGGFGAGQTRGYQVFYREDVLQQCGRGQNSTHAVSMTYGP